MKEPQPSSTTLKFRDDRPRGGDRWETPEDVFDALHRKYQFTVDAAAEAHNHRVERWFPSGLTVPWTGERVWCNPPYSDIEPWVRKADESDLTTFLLPAWTDRPWFHLMFDNETGHARAGWNLNFPKGRIRFRGAKSDPMFPSLIATFAAGRP